MTERPGADRPRIVIVGGGFSGAAIAYHLARLGAGLAYSASDAAHRINVPASRMSLDSAQPDQFRLWLDEGDHLAGDPAAFDARGDAFPQRGLFGRYVAAMLAPLLAENRIVHRRARAEAIHFTPGRSFEIALSEGSSLVADRLVLATTHPLPGVPAPIAPIRDSAGFIADPYNPDALRRIPPQARVLVLGNGLTAADVVASLDACGHRGPITTLSRNGLRARGHAPRPVEPYGRFDINPPQSALDLLRRIRRTIEDAARDGHSWHAVLDAVRSQGGTIWRALLEAERRKLVRHLRSFWDVHRFRIAPQVEDVLDRLTREGRLRSLAASLKDARDDGEALAVTVRHRRTGLQTTERFDAVINTTGPAHHAVTRQEPLASLHQAGWITPDRIGLGLATAEDGHALDRHRRPVPGLFIAGPLARGTFGELMGLPQVTIYAEFIAERLVKDLGHLSSD